MRIKKIFAIVLLVGGLNSFSFAEGGAYDLIMRPLDLKNQFVFYLPYLSMPLEKAKNMKAGTQELKVGYSKSSTFLDYYECDEKGVFDLETTTVTLQYATLLGGGYQIRFYVPFIYHGGGFMDPVIEGFHSAFGLPNGGRETWGTNKIIMERLGEGGQPLISINSAHYGLGDPAVFLKKEIYSENPYIALSGAVKVPLRSEAFVSSNTFDLGAGINLDYYMDELYFYVVAGGAYFLGVGYYKEELSREYNYSLNLGVGAGIQVSSGVSLFMQFYFQSSPYSTDISRIDRMSTVHSFGVRWFVVEDLLFQFSADEDTFTYSTTDIAFAVQFEYSF